MVADHPDCPAPRVSPEEDRRRRSVGDAEAAPPKPKPKPQVAIIAEQLAAAVEDHLSAQQVLEYYAARAKEASDNMRKLALEFDEEVKNFRAEIATP